MQLKINYKILLLIFILISCSKKGDVDEETIVINKMYNSILIPKSVPSPPKPKKNEEDIESLKKINFNKNKFIKYAINKKFVNFKIENSSKKFNVYNSKKLFEHTNISNEDHALLQNLNVKVEKNIDSNVFKKINKEEVVFLEKQFVNSEDKKEIGIDGIVSFSKVSFSKDKTKAAIAVGVHRGKLDSSLTIYILEKTDKDWKIKNFKVIEVS